ncbi:MAG: hypothetical protein K5905_17990 [Roseibium sp.]|uniref:HpcH/HpaI aldolase family protein n=1 Tax=Roseibium sp. TaxID=1936156 RepID=UPI00260F44C3|nr:aldolase/citrate lyase family protein [Roseibium sp.]MCV0427356.1 hypothetical protein [Roseibium sp.]
MTANERFKSRLTKREPLFGCFVKTPHPAVVEVLGQCGIDFLVLDGEHSPFDKATINHCLLAARAVDCATLVRVPGSDPECILNVLDCGAAGVVVPHVTSVAQAKALVRAVHYGQDGRGIAGTTRAGSYGMRPLSEHLASTRNEVSLICQIEDRGGVECAREIAAVSGVDALFVGRADLTVSYGLEDFNSAKIKEICHQVLGAREAVTGLYCAPGEDIGPWRSSGAGLFVIGADHYFLIQGAKALTSLASAHNPN